ncbi:FtsH protease activity modulator HflK [Algiphilus sp.]|uniref:FtsH protease activity modulator HflK n=1 Tax=Algiphilus sp. TaxID=1872431 RepID=UPI001CA7A862|nr:FtsH protease activity modulator HflK [Algiphilus sp.]MBY8966933.1 FtsH protease activity modulator HflK [Algiphilus acroporae]MCI5103569.1 FtsH protease activity modulator HflK [Algiphilus sp.]
MAWNEPGGDKDPWGSGNRGSNSPPDIEQMLKRFKDRFSGRGDGGGGSGGDGAGGKGPIMGAAVVIVGIIVALWVASGFYVVDEREQGVVLQFGAFSRVTQPGLRWHIPWPVEKVETINVTEIREASDRTLMLTEDENIVEVELRVQYRISDVQNYLFNVRNPDETLQQATKSSLREIVGQNNLDFVLVDGRAQVANLTLDRLQDILTDYGTGLFVTNVNLTDARAPAQVQDAFLDAIKAREDRVRLVNEAESYANDRIPSARGNAAREIEQAEGYRERVIARAEGDASRFGQLVAEVRRAPEITRNRLYLDTMTEVMNNTSKVLVDIDDSGSLMMLPLQEMLRGIGSGSSSDNQSSSAPPILGGGGSNSFGGRSNTNDARSRDRERR